MFRAFGVAIGRVLVTVAFAFGIAVMMVVMCDWHIRHAVKVAEGVHVRVHRVHVGRVDGRVVLVLL